MPVGSHELRSAHPPPALWPFIRAYAQREVRGVDLVQPVPASLEQILEFEFGDCPHIRYSDGSSERAHRVALIGAHSRPDATVSLGGHVESFAVFLQPLALWSLFRVPVAELADRSYPAADVLGRRIAELAEQLAESPSFEHRVRVCNRYFTRRLPEVAGRSAVMDAAAFAFRRGGLVGVGELAERSTLSIRQFERRFIEEVGIQPKLFARIARFQTALDAKVRHPDRSWLRIAATSGYFDQMHLVHEFRLLSGAAPNVTMAALGDIRPPQLAAAPVVPGERDIRRI